MFTNFNKYCNKLFNKKNTTKRGSKTSTLTASAAWAAAYRPGAFWSRSSARKTQRTRSKRPSTATSR